MQKIKAARRQQKLLEELDPIQRELLRRQLAQSGGGLPSAPPAGVTPAPPGMPAAPLTPAAPPGATPNAAGPAGVPAPLPAAPPAGGAPGDLGPAAGEYGAWSAPTGVRLAPAAPPPLKTTEADPSSQFAGLLGGGSPYAQLASFPGPGPLGSSGGGGYGDNPFAGAGALAAAGGDEPAGGPDVVIPSGPRLQRSDLTNVAATGRVHDRRGSSR